MDEKLDEKIIQIDRIWIATNLGLDPRFVEFSPVGDNSPRFYHHPALDGCIILSDMHLALNKGEITKNSGEGWNGHWKGFKQIPYAQFTRGYSGDEKPVDINSLSFEQAEKEYGVGYIRARYEKSLAFYLLGVDMRKIWKDLSKPNIPIINY
ncbi:MAG: hypothetical protein AABX48_00460 [Nanoarchaeota archaeon]